jgi:hypothetical protein
MKPVVRLAQRRLVQKLSNSNKSQALSELAIFGTLIIVGFAAMLSYLQSMNSQQSLQMEAFRKAVRRARTMNSEVTYTIIKDAPVVDIGDFFGRPNTSRQSASAHVFAAEHDNPPADDNDPNSRDIFEYYEVNGQGPFEISPIQINNVYQHGEQSFWTSAPIADTEYQTRKQRSGSITKNENPGSITTTRAGNVNVQDTTILVLERQADYERKALEDGQSYVQKHSWERTYRNQQFVAQLMVDIEFLYWTILARPVSGICGPDIIGKTAMISAIGLIVTDIFGYLLTNDNPNGGLVAVHVISPFGDRGVAGSKIFSENQPAFTVSH